MREAVDRIKLAVSQGEPIMIYGDYDADGVTSTSVMLTALRQLSADVDFIFPTVSQKATARMNKLSAP